MQYSYELDRQVSDQIPDSVLKAMSREGWNAFGIYELVRRLQAKERHNAALLTNAPALCEMLSLNWISADDRRPEKHEFYFVWIPEWEGYGNVSHGDVAYWNGHDWSEGNFPAIEDGAPVSHWAFIQPPVRNKEDLRAGHGIPEPS